MVKQGLLTVLSGPSGAGKGTICQGLLKETKDISLSISVTTRPPRPGEEHGKNYLFMSRGEFEQMLKKDLLLEWAKVYGNYYGTPRKWVESKLAKGNDVLLEIDIQGALQIKKKFPECILIFIVPPSINELQERLIGRGTDRAEVIAKRLKCVKSELREIDQYDFIVVNDKLEVAVEQVKAIITAEKCRPKYFDVHKYFQYGGLHE